MKRNEDELNRPVYRQALAHSCLLLRFLSTGGEANDSKKKNPLWLLVSGIIFHLCPHGSPAWGARGLRLGCSMFGFFPRSAASCGESERETAADNVATGKHVQTTASGTSSPAGSGGSRQRRIILRTPDFIKERLLLFFNLLSH